MTTPPEDAVADQPKPDDYPEVMYLVRSRTDGGTGGTWAEWDELWHDLIRKVSERAAEQKGSHPGFDVIEVRIERHAVVRPTVSVEDGASVGWHDAPSHPPLSAPTAQTGSP